MITVRIIKGGAWFVLQGLRMASMLFFSGLLLSLFPEATEMATGYQGHVDPVPWFWWAIDLGVFGVTSFLLQALWRKEEHSTLISRVVPWPVGAFVISVGVIIVGSVLYAAYRILSH